MLSPEDYRMVGDVTERFPLAVAPDETLLEALARFRQGDSHMAIVTNNPEVCTPPHLHSATLFSSHVGLFSTYSSNQPTGHASLLA